MLAALVGAPIAAAAVGIVASEQHEQPGFAADESVKPVAWPGVVIDSEGLELELRGQLPVSELAIEPTVVGSAAVRTLGRRVKRGVS